MVNGVVCSVSMLHRKAFRNIYITLYMSGWCKRCFFSSFLSLGHHSRSHFFLDHLTLSCLFHPQSEWVTSHSPAQSGLYELITLSFHSPGKCLDVRTHQRRTECCRPPPIIWTTDCSRLWNTLRMHSEVSTQLRMRQIKYLCFVTWELHKRFHMIICRKRTAHCRA